MELIKSV